MIIDSQFSLGGKCATQFSINDIKNEPMLFSCDLDHASWLGGPLTEAFLSLLPHDWRSADDFIVDSRVHMLKENWYPAIPGYHHDDVPRSRVDGQPNYIDPEYRSEHVMMLVNADVCPTWFAVGSAEFPIPDVGRTIYKDWHRFVEFYVDNGQLAHHKLPDRTLCFFDDRTWHQATPAVKAGWRWFIRASRRTHRKPANELRRQVQVYMENPVEGW